MAKKKYAPPELVVLGKVQEITQGFRFYGFRDGNWGMGFHRPRRRHRWPENGGS